MKKQIIPWISVFALCLAFNVSKGQNYALDFTGSSSDAVIIPDTAALDISTEITLEAWIYADNWRGQVWEGTVIGKENNDQTGYILRTGDGGDLQLNLGMAGSWVDVRTTNDPMQAGTWYHVAGTFDGTTLKVFINGVEVASNASSGTIGINTRPVEIGRLDLYNSRYFDGQIDEVRIWSKALSGSTLSTWANGVTSAHPDYSDLEAYYKMDDNLTTTVVADSAGIHDGSIVGSVTYVGVSLTCLSPVFVPTSVTATTADLNWVSNAGQFEYEYDTAGFVMGTGNNSALTTDTFANISGLQSNTSYDFYVRAICAAGDTSSWVLASFTTPCVSVGIPYSQDYSVWPLNCWDLTGGTRSFSDANGAALANYWSWNTGNDAFMTSPVITVSQNARVKFKWSHLYNSTYPIDGMVLRAQEAGTSNWDTIWFNQGPSFDSQDGAGSTSPGSFVQETFLLDSATYTGKDYSFQFHAISGFGPNAYIDDFLVEVLPACPEPLGVDFLWATDSSVTFAFQSGENNFDTEWGPSGFIQGTGTTGTSNDDTTTVTSLTSNTCYDFYIRANCIGAGNGTSIWVGPYTFCTSCLPVVTLPYTESFEVNGLNCWKVVDNDNDGVMWSLDTLAGNAYTGSNSASLQSPFNGTTDDWLISPKVTLTGNERLKYYTRTAGNFDDVAFLVAISTTNDSLSSFTDTLAPLSVLTGSSYVQTQVNLSAYSGDVYIAFIGSPPGFNSGTVKLDEIIIEPLPLCLEPDSFAFVTATSSYAVFNWAAGGGSTWNLEYGSLGYTPGTGTITNVSSTTDTIFGLSTSTNYDVYVQSDCIGSTSIWIGPLNFTTSCLTQTLPYTEDFNIDLGCMVAVDGGTTPDTWVTVPAGGTANTSGDIDGTGYALIDSDEFGNGEHLIEALNSPPIDAGSLPSTSSLVIEWDQYYNDLTSDSAFVQVYDGTGWVTILTQLSAAGSFANPDHQLIDVTTYANANFQVRFVYDDGNSWAWFWAVDNFSVTEQLCGIASNPDTTFVTPFSAGLTWTSNGSNWNIEWGPAGFIQGTGVGGTIKPNTTDNPDTLFGLQASTCYDYYVQDTCLGIGAGPWAGPFTFCTPASCPVPSNLSASNVTLNSIDVSWIGGGVGADYNVEYGTAGFTLGTGTMANTTATSYTMLSLNPSTTYDIYLRDSCGIGDVSLWVGPITVSTLCATFSVPFLEDFDANGFISGTGFNNAGDAINSCWSRSDNTGGGNFLGTRSGTTGSGGTGPSSGVNGTNYVFYEASGSGTGDTAWLDLPVIDLSGTTSPYFKYQYHMFGNDMGNLSAEVNSGSGWVNLNTLSGQQQTAEADPFLTDSIDVTAYIGSAVQFRFIATSGGGFGSDMAIENVQVADAVGSQCGDPIGLDTANVSCVDADLVWTSSSATIASAIEYGPAGFTPGTGAGTIVANATSPQSVSSLLSGTNYEFYVVDFCSTDTSNVVGPFAFKTASGPLSAAYTYTIGIATSANRPVDFDASTSVGANTYAWDFGDGNAGTGATPTNIYTTNGTYSVQLIISGDCGIDSITQQVVVTGISLTENRLGRSLQVYPNPSVGQVNVIFNAESSNDATIGLLDLSGKVIMSTSSTHLNGKYEGKIDISELSKGTYLMKVESGDLTTQRRIIKQ